MASSAGVPPIITVEAPGPQGAGIDGTQALGVGVPPAAAVAACTAGFCVELHMPNGGIMAPGALFIMVALGGPESTRLAGGMVSVLGATPKLHCITAPAQINIAIGFP